MQKKTTVSASAFRQSRGGRFPVSSVTVDTAASVKMHLKPAVSQTMFNTTQRIALGS